MQDKGLVSIADAAWLAGVSRRTVERWIRDGKLHSVPNEEDRRQRLVHLAELAPLVRRAKSLKNGERGAASRENNGHESRNVCDEEALIDQLLQLVYSHDHLLVSRLMPSAFQPVSLNELRRGPLAQAMQFLVSIGKGELVSAPRTVRETVESVLQLLFWPAASDDYSVPMKFWATQLGRVLMLAKSRAFAPRELLSVTQAADELGVSRPAIRQWVEDRTLDFVLEPHSGRMLVVRRDVEALKRLMDQFQSASVAASASAD